MWGSVGDARRPYARSPGKGVSPAFWGNRPAVLLTWECFTGAHKKTRIPLPFALGITPVVLDTKLLTCIESGVAATGNGDGTPVQLPREIAPWDRALRSGPDLSHQKAPYASHGEYSWPPLNFRCRFQPTPAPLSVTAISKHRDLAIPGVRSG